MIHAAVETAGGVAHRLILPVKETCLIHFRDLCGNTEDSLAFCVLAVPVGKALVKEVGIHLHQIQIINDLVHGILGRLNIVLSDLNAVHGDPILVGLQHQNKLACCKGELT